MGSDKPELPMPEKPIVDWDRTLIMKLRLWDDIVYNDGKPFFQGRRY